MTARPKLLFVEGGGDHNPSLASECRRAFGKLFERAGVESRPRVVVCGGRKNAYDKFCQALAEGDSDAWLLVDAEEVMSSGPFDPWAHVKARVGDGWDRPAGAKDEYLQLMAVCMETWLVADRAALKAVFGPKVDLRRLPAPGISLEGVEKSRIQDALAKAAAPTPAETYGKGSHSFKVLALVEPASLRVLSWAARFLDEMGATR